MTRFRIVIQRVEIEEGLLDLVTDLDLMSAAGAANSAAPAAGGHGPASVVTVASLDQSEAPRSLRARTR